MNLFFSTLSKRLTILVLAFLPTLAGISQTTTTFGCTGAPATFTVPPCVFSITITAAGADGGGGLGGNGATITCPALAVTPGQVITMTVGCSGNNSGSAASGGYGGTSGGGRGWPSNDGTVSYNSSGGGGATTVTVGGSPYVVAGGGGGEGGGSGIVGGGAGGCPNGVTGVATFGLGGIGATTTGPGAGGTPWAATPPGGSPGVGGTGGMGGFWGTASGGGGGGGYFGGGGGGNDGCCTGANGGGGGGGGSSLIPAGGGCAQTNNGPGFVNITYLPGSITPTVNSPTICAGAAATLTATGGTTYTWSNGATGASISVSPATTTSYTVTASNGACTGTAVSTVTVNPLPTVVAETNLTYCAGAAVPANTFASTPAGATFTWTSSNPAIGMPAAGVTSLPAFTATNPGAGPITSTITITPTLSGCTGPTSTFTITVNPLPVTTVNSPTICTGGTATLTAGGAFSYVWSTGATTNPINVTPAGTTSYTVTGTSSGCTSSAVGTVTVAAAMVVTVNSPTICSGVAATLTATGGTTYAWSSGATGNPINVTPATTTSYTVTGTTGGCTGTAVATVTVNPTPVTTSTNSTICAGSSTTLTAGGAASYTWSTGSTTNPLSVTPATTTSYTVTGSSLGCTSTAVGIVTVNPMPVTTVNSPTICPGTTATLTAGGATTYSWDTGATTNPINVTPVTTTSYTVTGTSLGCSTTAVATVTVNAAITPNAGVNDTVCFGGSAVLGVTPSGAGYTYSWAPAGSLAGATTATPTATPTATTTYTVTLTDPTGCTGTATVTIFADPMIDLSAIVGLPATCFGACDGQSIVIPAGGSGTFSSYSWSGGCTAAACNQCAGTYTVTVTDSWGCTNSNSATVTQPTLLTASSTNTPASCNGVCDGTATATAAGGTTPYGFSWNSVPVQPTATATGLCAGTYTCTITDGNGCTATTTATITEPTLVVTAPITPAVVCSGGSAMITASASGGNGGPYTYVWTPAASLDNPNISNPTATPAATTVYTVNASDASGCPAAPVNVTVTVNPGLAVVATGTASICPGQSTTLTATPSLGNGGPYTITWLPTGSGSPLTVSPATTTTYTVVVSDGCSPTASTTVTVTVLPLPVVSFSTPLPDSCANHCVTFNNTSTAVGGILTSVYDYGDGSTPSTNATHCYSVASDGSQGIYSVTLTVTSTAGCVSSLTMPNYINVYPIPVAEFTAPFNTSIINPDVTYTDLSYVVSGAIVGWNWDFGDPFAVGADTGSTSQNPTHTFTEAGTFCATLTVVSNHGCVATQDHCLIIQPEFTFFIPNAFSPNGDGINDEFYGKGDFIKKFSMSIYDRWGNLTFFTEDLNKHWDGKAKHGKEVALEDVYVYKVAITDANDKKHTYTGTVTIVK